MVGLVGRVQVELRLLVIEVVMSTVDERILAYAELVARVQLPIAYETLETI